MQRRQVLSLSGLLALPLELLAAISHQHPADSQGPFYPVAPIPLRSDLVLDHQALGKETVLLHGQVLSRQGKAIVGAKVEIWQCDIFGRYDHPAQSQHAQFDPRFAGFGAQLTDDAGAYRFTTLKPVPYSGRPPHIHAKIWHDEKELLTTQLYPTAADKVTTWRAPLQLQAKRDAQGLLSASFTFVV